MSTLDNYSTAVNRAISSMPLDILEALECKDVHCTKSCHCIKLDKTYDFIVTVLKDCSNTVIPSRSSIGKDIKYKVMPGWNEHVREAHTAARESFKAWQCAGKPRSGPVHDIMRHTRHAFKYSLRHCRKHEEQARADALARALSSDKNGFWKGLRSQTSSRTSNPTSIDGVSGDANVLHLWYDHYKELFSCTERDSEALKAISCYIDSISYDDTIIVNSNEVTDALNKLKGGKSSDLDGISAEHLIYFKERLVKTLCMFFTSLLVHGYMPQAMIKSVLVPVVKNKTRSITDKSNYRPIAISTVLSKVFEFVLFGKMEPYLLISDNQFGYQKDLGTEICIFTLMETIRHYQMSGSHVFICYLDATAAFDRLCHTTLFRKLIDKGIPLYIIRILYYWYIHQQLCVRWNNVYSNFFQVTNGVRQGGVLSCHLFNVYMDKLSFLLNKQDVGCCINGRVINHLMYADDSVLLAPSVKGLQKLINIVSDYGLEHNILFNKTKTVCMHILGRGKKWQSDEPVIKIGQHRLSFVKEYKYLGYLVCSDLSDDSAIHHQVRSMYCRAHMLKNRFKMCTEYIKVLLFKLFCCNIYCAGMWCNYKQLSLSRMRIAYNNAFRILMKLPKNCSAIEMFVNRRINTFHAIIRNQMYSLMFRISESKNSFVNAIYESDICLRSCLFHTWEEALNMNNS